MKTKFFNQKSFLHKLPLVAVTLLGFTTFAQKTNINEELKKELDQIMWLDQSSRELFQSQIKPERKKQLLKELKITEEQSKDWKFVDDLDNKNLAAINRIINQYGYPGKSLVGEPTNKAAWYVIQHAGKDMISRYISLIKKAVDNSELAFTYYATMLDRHLMNEKKPQIYGTQGYGGYWFNENTEKEEWIEFIWPLKNQKKVNQWRIKAGFSETFEENAKNLYREKYMVLTLPQALKVANYKKHWK